METISKPFVLSENRGLVAYFDDSNGSAKEQKFRLHFSTFHNSNLASFSLDGSPSLDDGYRQ
jgi:hypothetical protein